MILKDLRDLKILQKPKPRTKSQKKKKTKNTDWQKEYCQQLRENVQPLVSDDSSMAGVGSKKSIFDTKWKNPYIDDMADRENRALEKAERLKSRIAPAYNKGAYQLLTEGTDLSEVGKKI